ncbi:MAG: hypothetical protein A2830_03695 [Candidatus Taylorbacteria bacterium RIFCSPHIGHO2_01_FULL_44_110]|nr:MAG: hypothetical protein A2830_03695 [Candidatus Taylorbacteria bacterium RIFCSPHIGHO2_01_FULL_44_110]OHA39394.1 MAG: hypothetical protein A3I98_02335 [Candidatus Taylorbacteria bacterium RIFCSPLOWO2_02_FULL_45_10b]OHA44341.1 MAG: hypothetical protein A3G04_03315 [Candidatus Taylorbacteria bacterium RIFCSPLOWO2_12_FULL_44_9]
MENEDWSKASGSVLKVKGITMKIEHFVMRSIAPLRNPWVAWSILIGSIALSMFFTLVDPAPVRHWLGL